MKNEEQIIIEKLNNFNNQYICLGNMINIGSPISAKSVINLINLIDNNTNDINEVFITRIVKGYRNDLSFKISSIANVLTEVTFSNYENWKNSDTEKLFNILSDRGLNFNNEIINTSFHNVEKDFFLKFKNVEDFLNGIKETNEYSKNSEIYSITTEYGSVKSDIEKQIYLLKKAYEQTSQEMFNKKIQEYGTLHKAVSFSQISLIKFLLSDCLVPVNLEDDMGQNAIFVAQNIASLDTIDNFNPDWMKKNKQNKDVLSVYTRHNKDIGKQLIEYAQKKMSGLLKEKGEDHTHLIEARMKESLLEMVKKDKTKKEIVDFIKKYNINNFSDIKDEKGNNLLHIIIDNGSWSKAEIFIDHYGIDEVNENGLTYIGQMFNKTYVHYENQAKNLMDKLIAKESFEKNPKFSKRYLESRLIDGRNISFPDWYLYNRGDTTKIDGIYKSIIKNEKDKDIIFKDFQKLDYNKQSYNYNTVDEKENKSIHFYLGHAISKNKDFKLTDLNLKVISDEMNISSFTKNKEDIFINNIGKESFNRALEIMSMAFKFSYFEPLEPKMFSEKLENLCASNILFNFNKIEKEISKGSILKEKEKMLISSFFDSNIDVLSYYTEKESKVFEELLSNDKIWNAFYAYTKEGYKRDSEKEKTLKYLDMIKMNSKLNSIKEPCESESKIKKIKI